MPNKGNVLVGVIVDNHTFYPLQEFCEICQADIDSIIEMVNYEIIYPQGKNQEEWRFPATQLMRSKKALRIHHDLELNWHGVALVLDLLEDLNETEQRLEQLETWLHINSHPEK